MKVKSFIIPLLGIVSALASCHSNRTKETAATPVAAVQDIEQVISDSIRFCESTYPYQGGLLIANFGTEQLNPLNTEGKGYILYYKDGTVNGFIPADGYLNAPKGMYEQDGYLFICDVNKIMVYNLNNLQALPQTILFPKGDLFVNDLAAKGDTLFASVTNTGKIYNIDISDKTALDKAKPKMWCEVAGANGILIDGNAMYVASYPADGNTTPDNVIYCIADISMPKAEKFTSEGGQYDGLALSADKKTLYVTNWNPAGVYSIDMVAKQLVPLNMQTKVTGAADMTLVDSTLFIPDLPNSRVIEFPLSSK